MKTSCATLWRNRLLLCTALLCVTVFSARSEMILVPLPGLDQAKQKASALDCYINLREIWDAAKAWSVDHGNQFPTNFQVFTNEMESPSILFCPADTSRVIPTNWTDVDFTKVDYTWIPQTNWNDPSNICCTCRIHTHALHVDSAVDPNIGRERDGWPVIIAAPVDVWATPGSDIQFAVRVAPNALLPLNYQWRREHLTLTTNITFVTNYDGSGTGYWKTNPVPHFAVTNLAGETNDTLQIHNVKTKDTDFYSVTVSNSMGTTFSRTQLRVDSMYAGSSTDEHWFEISCINNLKQIALLANLCATDHNDEWPQSLMEMTNRFGSPSFGWPLVLYCPSDEGRTAPSDWPGVDFENTSYEILPTDAQDGYAVYCRCKIHGFYAQQNGITISHPTFTEIRPLTNNVVELNFQVFAGKTNWLETSDDLLTWTNLATFSSTNGILSVHATNNFSKHFYRIRAK